MSGDKQEQTKLSSAPATSAVGEASALDTKHSGIKVATSALLKIVQNINLCHQLFIDKTYEFSEMLYKYKSIPTTDAGEEALKQFNDLLTVTKALMAQFKKLWQEFDQIDDAIARIKKSVPLAAMFSDKEARIEAIIATKEEINAHAAEAMVMFTSYLPKMQEEFNELSRRIDTSNFLTATDVAKRHIVETLVNVTLPQHASEDQQKGFSAMLFDRLMAPPVESSLPSLAL